jgi:hypothetical protein
LRRALLAALAVNLGLAAACAVLWAQRLGSQPPGDFTALYTAAVMVHDGQGSALYDFALQGRVQSALPGAPALPEGPMLYLHPPHTALALVPLHHHDLRRAFALWTALQLAWLVWLLRLVGRGRPLLERLSVCAAVLAAPPLLLTLTLGSLSLLLLIVALKVHQALAERRDRAAGLWLALGTLKPQLVMTQGLATLVARRWRAVAAATAAILIAVLVTGALLGFSVWLDFVRVLSAARRDYEQLRIHPGVMDNLQGALLFAVPALRPAAPTIALLGWLGACAGVVWIWWRPVSPAHPGFHLRMAATLLLGSFFSVYFHPQDSLILVAVALLCERYLVASGRPRSRFAALVLVAPALWFLTQLVWRPPFVRFAVLFQLALGGWIIRAWRPMTIGSGETSPPEPLHKAS